MKAIKKHLVNLSKKYPRARALRHSYVTNRNKILRPAYQLKPVQDKLVIFESFNGRSYSDSPRAIYEEMLNDPRFDDFKFIWVFKNPKKYKYPTKEPRTSLVKYRTPRYYQSYAKAKYWIVNAMIPLQITKKPEQVMVQCWHGTPLKRLRNDIIENTKNAMNSLEDFKRKNNVDTARYNYFISPSRFATEKFTTAFALKELGKEDIIIETGYPRNDLLFKYTKRDQDTIKNQLNLPRDDRKTLLYTPTWRDDQHTSGTGYTYESPVDFDLLQKELSDEYIILFRAHYLIANKFDFSKYEDFIFNASNVDDVSELYIISDALITDYSSTFFDFANLRKPIHFFMYDKEHYETQLRGFYLDLDELPGRITETEKDLIEDIRAGELSSNYREFNEKFNHLDSESTSRKLIEVIFS